MDRHPFLRDRRLSISRIRENQRKRGTGVYPSFSTPHRRMALLFVCFGLTPRAAPSLPVAQGALPTEITADGVDFIDCAEPPVPRDPAVVRETRGPGVRVLRPGSGLRPRAYQPLPGRYLRRPRDSPDLAPVGASGAPARTRGNQTLVRAWCTRAESVDAAPLAMSWPGDAKTQVAVAVGRLVPVPIGGPQVDGRVVPTAAPVYAVRSVTAWSPQKSFGAAPGYWRSARAPGGRWPNEETPGEPRRETVRHRSRM